MSEIKRGGDRRTEQQLLAAQERAAQMAALRAGGMTLAAIAQQFGVTRQRVHAILTAQDPGELATRQDVLAALGVMRVHDYSGTLPRKDGEAWAG